MLAQISMPYQSINSTQLNALLNITSKNIPEKSDAFNGLMMILVLYQVAGMELFAFGSFIQINLSVKMEWTESQIQSRSTP